jgi:dTMP kinase
MGYMTEALLYASARAQLVSEVIKPALESGKAVISDRFIDSSAVYQGMARGLGVENIYKINEYATQGIMPDVTFLLDLPAKTGIGRKKDQKELDRMELESIEFHEKVAQGYRDLAKLSPERIYTVDATADIETVSENIIKKLQEIM